MGKKCEMRNVKCGIRTRASGCWPGRLDWRSARRAPLSGERASNWECEHENGPMDMLGNMNTGCSRKPYRYRENLRMLESTCDPGIIFPAEPLLVPPQRAFLSFSLVASWRIS